MVGLIYLIMKNLDCMIWLSGISNGSRFYGIGFVLGDGISF